MTNDTVTRRKPDYSDEFDRQHDFCAHHPTRHSRWWLAGRAYCDDCIIQKRVLARQKSEKNRKTAGQRTAPNVKLMVVNYTLG